MEKEYRGKWLPRFTRKMAVKMVCLFLLLLNEYHYSATE